MQKKVNIVNNLEGVVLEAIIVEFGASLFDINGLLGLDIAMIHAKSELKLALWRLCEMDLVISLRKIAGEKVYYVPYDICRERLSERLASLPLDLNPLLDVEEDHESAQQDIVMDIIILLTRINRGQVKLNKKGQLDKKLVEVLSLHIRISPDRLTALVGQDAMKHPIPIRIGILIDLGLRLGVIEKSEGQFGIDRERVIQWLMDSAAKLKINLYELFLNVHYPQDSFIRQLVIVIPLLTNEVWYSVEDLYTVVARDKLGAQIPNELKLSDIETFLQAVQELGWIQLGQGRDGVRAIRSLIDRQLTGYEHENVQWYVQPDYEIVVPLSAHYSDHYQFNSYATLITRNRMCTYRITKESIHTAFEQGYTLEQIMQHLESCARYGIPESIRTSMTEWNQQFRGVQLDHVMVLRCDTEAIAEQLLSLPDVAIVLNEQNRLGLKMFVIPEEYEAFIQEKMNTYGYRTDICSKMTHSMRTSNDKLDPSGGMYHSSIRYDMYTRDDRRFELESIYPGLANIPNGWLHANANYHNSTRKQIVQQAIDWQCYVLITQSGEEILLAPYLMTDEGANPLANGYYCGKLHQIYLDKLDTIRLILPGIHDVTKFMSTT